jgi:hypothetical protein
MIGLGIILAIVAGFFFAPVITGIVLGSLALIVGLMIFDDFKNTKKEKLKESTSNTLTTKPPETMVNPKPNHAVASQPEANEAGTNQKPSDAHQTSANVKPGSNRT